MTTLYEKYRGLYLSADDLRKMTRWPDDLIEDYLNVNSNLITISTTIDKNSVVSNIQTITGDYSISKSDGVILVDCSLNDVTISLNTDAEASQHHVIKCIDNTNRCYVSPNGNMLDNDAGNFELYQDESIDVKADSDNNWWII